MGPYIVKEKYVFMASHECQINASTNGLHPTAQEREEKDIGKKNILKIRKQSKLYLLSVVTNSKLDRNQISKVFFPCNVGIRDHSTGRAPSKRPVAFPAGQRKGKEKRFALRSFSRKEPRGQALIRTPDPEIKLQQARDSLACAHRFN